MIYMNVKLIEEQESCWLACGWKRINDKNLNKLSKLRSMSSNHLPFTWEKPAPLPGLARLAESPGLTTFIFRRNRESDICVQVFIL